MRAAILRTLLLFTLPAVCAPFCCHAGGDIDDLRGLVLNNAKIPVYQKTRLQMMIFADRGERKGTVLHGENVILEIIRRGADIDAIADGWGTKPYRLQCPFAEVLNFWRKRYLYSDAVMVTSKAMLMQNERRAAGREPVFFRSPLLDLDGLGFTADFERRTIQVSTNVKIVVRLNGSDPRAVAGKKAVAPKEYRPLLAEGDSLLIDMDHRQIMLVGSVHVADGDATLLCDRLTLFLTTGDEEETTDTPFKDTPESANLSRILADGNVEIERKREGNTSQKAFSDHLLYDVRSGMVELTGDDSVPRVISEKGDELQGEKITYFRNTQQLAVTGRCRISRAAEKGAKSRQTIRSDRGNFDFGAGTGNFTGNVELLDNALRLTGNRMNLLLDQPGANALPGVTSSMLPGEEIGRFGGGTQLKRVVFPDKVNVVNSVPGKSEPMRLSADHGEYLAADNGFVFNGNVNSEDGSMKLKSERMVLKLTPETPGAKRGVQQIDCDRSVQIVSKTGVRTADGNGLPSGSSLDSEHATFFYNENKLVFDRLVHVRDSKGSLDCDRLEVYLADTGKASPRTGQVLGTPSDSKKELRKIVAKGHVHMVDPDSTLDTEQLTLHFRRLAPGEKNTSGMFQSGSAKLHRIECADGMSAVTGKGKDRRTIQAKNAIINVDKNESELHREVSLSDAENKLQCDDLYAYCRNAAAPAAKTPAAPADPDADPFAVIDSETYAPSRVALNSSTDLDHIVCKNHVRVTRSKQGTIPLVAGGDQGVYDVAKRMFVITGIPPRQAYLAQGKRRQLCDKIVYNLLTERFDTYGKTITVNE